MGSEVLGVLGDRRLACEVGAGPAEAEGLAGRCPAPRLGASQAALVLLQLSRRLGSRWGQPGSGASVLFSS